MCYSTRQARQRKELEKILSIESMFGDPDSELELISFHANGWGHPILWTITQEEPQNMLPALWGIMPAKENQGDHKEYFTNPRTFGSLNARSERLFDPFIYLHCWERPLGYGNDSGL